MASLDLDQYAFFNEPILSQINCSLYLSCSEQLFCNPWKQPSPLWQKRGANKGIEICRQLASNGIIVVLTARDETKGTRAVEALKVSGLTDVIFHQLDVNDAISVTSFADFMKTRYRKVDILVNNAGDNGITVQISEAIKDLNVRDSNEKDETANLVTEALLRLLRLSNSERIVNVSSLYGQLKFISSEMIKEELSNVHFLTNEKLDELMRKFLKDFKEDFEKATDVQTEECTIHVPTDIKESDPSNALMRNIDRPVTFSLRYVQKPSLEQQKRGANKGIGLEICRQLASNGIIVVLTARDETKGTRAVEALKMSGLTDVIYHQLDVNDATSVTSLAGFIKTRYGKLDILVNNAGDNGVRLKISEEAMKDLNFQFGDEKDEIAKLLEESIEDTYERAKQSIETNYYGTKRVTEALLPLLQLSNSARIVNVSSVYGQLKFISNETTKEELRNVDCLTVEKIDELMQKFLKDFKDGMLETNGWPVLIYAYKVSKAAINAYTRILARKFPSLCVNAVHPGLVKTDISFHQGNLTPDEGAKAPVMVALLPSDGPSGF
ncbi:hypothetical protein MKW98_032160 [Papaver atlanticum]|uniref:Uncharacterized protein n=1 Tax=Papaver atlanticum TaxID=357466 RepID=A0AAD4SH85_9MAGN|nr:hypothetical protein MKW98_032160 [Papaver atlanticum]